MAKILLTDEEIKKLIECIQDGTEVPEDFEFCSITGNIGNVMHFSGSYRPPETL